ncbi:MAG TPA: cupin domain-containing protein [Alphaproteobacteria bacterium]|nr:cupin domain-containing protein [Alphaproteobacteria bacterium]
MDSARRDAGLIAALEEARLHPLWTRYKQITPIHPAAQDAPMHWRWRDIEPLTRRAAAEVPIEDVERRAIIMVNPAFGGATATTSNLIGAFTVLEPGDKAVPHRHVAAAIRFSTRAEGAATIVNGRRCAMEPGDLILTPPMCWHGHINDSGQRTIWFDAANMPLINALDANFFEPGSRQANDFWQVDEGEERLWDAAGLVSGDQRPQPISPKYRYPGAATRRLLAATAPGADGARTVRYVNPLTGGPVMPTLDCYAVRLAGGQATRPRRGTWNAVCLVVSGEGRSTVGDHSFEWAQHDVFSIPHWTFAQHTALSGDADLFIVTDKAVYEKLDLIREELQ